MPYLPNEIVNIILSYVERPKHAKIIKYLIQKGYKSDFNPDEWVCWCYDQFYRFQYSFYEWYFLYRKKYVFGRNHTPTKLIVGGFKEDDNYRNYAIVPLDTWFEDMSDTDTITDLTDTDSDSEKEYYIKHTDRYYV